MKNDDPESEDSGSSERRLNLAGAVGFAVMVLILTWIFPLRGRDDWWTLTYWEIANAIGMFFIALYILRKKPQS